MAEPAGHDLEGTTDGYGLGALPSPRAVLIDAGNALLGGRPFGGRVVALGPGLEVGRGTRAAVVAGRWEIPDRHISSRHASITGGERGYVLEDLGSRNGTVCDGRRIVGSQPLRDGTRLFLGSQAAVFKIVSVEILSALAEEEARPLGPVPTASPQMALALRRLRRLAIIPEDLLIAGETGTGKEVYARAVHAASRRPGKFVAINCAALPAELVESELFGYLRGAHSLAVQSKPGLIEQADRGTLFLDEIGDMPLASQAKLLRFVQTREYLPLGGVTPRRVDVRVLAATSHADASSSAPGLRADLAGRLGAEPIVLPALRERPEDIGTFIAHFLAAEKRDALELDPAAFFALLLHGWARNVRELEKTVREAVAMAADSPVIRLDHLPPALTGRLDAPAPPSASPDGAAADRRRSPRPLPTKSELETLLEEHGGNVAAVARNLHRQAAVVWRAIERYAIDTQRFRSPDRGE